MSADAPRAATMNISLSEPLRDFVAERVESAGYSSVSEYIRELIRRDQKLAANETLEAKLLEALGTPLGEMTPDEWATLRDEVARRHRRRAAK